jgi:hypothetical protein
MDVNEHERLSNFTLRNILKVREQRFYYCSTLHSHSMVFNNEFITCSKMSEKASSLHLSRTLYFCPLTIQKDYNIMVIKSFLK